MFVNNFLTIILKQSSQSLPQCLSTSGVEAIRFLDRYLGQRLKKGKSVLISSQAILTHGLVILAQATLSKAKHMLSNFN